jgi:hypothetical protein
MLDESFVNLLRIAVENYLEVKGLALPESRIQAQSGIRSEHQALGVLRDERRLAGSHLQG